MLKLSVRKSQSGQALLEYVLLLIIIVAAFALLKGTLFSNIGNYVKVSMGDYLGCLLDRAVLPLDPNCAGILAQANPSTGGGVSNNGGDGANKNGGGAGGSGASSSAVPTAKSEMANSRNGTAESGRGSSGGRRGGGRRGPGPGSAATTSDTNAVMNDGEGPQVSTVGTAKQGNIKIIRVSAAGRNGPQVTGLGGASQEELEKRERTKNKVLSVNSLSAGENEPGTPKKTKVVQTSRKIASQVEEDKAVGFGSIGRIVIIVIIILALVIFLGSQANQISKSMDK